MEEEEELMQRQVGSLRRAKPGLSRTQAEKAVKVSGTTRRRYPGRRNSRKPSRKMEEEEELMQRQAVGSLRSAKPGLSKTQAEKAVKVSGTVRRRYPQRRSKRKPSRKGIIEPVIYR